MAEIDVLAAGLSGSVFSTGVADDRTDSAEHFSFNEGIDRTVKYDLGAECAVCGCEGCFMMNQSSALWPPHYFRLALSDDGENWQTVGETTPDYGSEATAVIKMNIPLDEMRLARYAALSFPVQSRVVSTSLAVYGVRGGDGRRIEPDAPLRQTRRNRYALPEDFGGMRDLVLLYNGYSGEHSGEGRLTRETLLPYTAYFDRQGRIADTFFDGFLFLPCLSPTPSGGSYYDNNSNPSTLDDWKYYIDDLFADGVNLRALNAAAGDAAAATGAGYRPGVVLTVLYPTAAQRRFGTLDGRALDFSSGEDRRAAIKWYIDELCSRFYGSGCDNLRLVGMYWFCESINYGDADERDLIRFTTSYLRAKGLLSLWIPWYSAPGFNEWDSFGFDVACMQPNYAFAQQPVSALYNTAEMTQRLGMCVEMEIDGMNREAVARYRTYLKCGVQKGFSDALHIYYQDSGPGVFHRARLADEPRSRSAYHDTYLFSRRRLTVGDTALDTERFTVKRKTEFRGVITSHGSPLKTALAAVPKHGSLALYNDGRFIYTPHDAFTGEDHFFIDAGEAADIFEITLSVE